MTEVVACLIMGCMDSRLVVVLAVAIGQRAAAQSFTWFSPAEGYQSSYVSGLSSDGTRVSGWNADNLVNPSGFWATTSGERQNFGLNPGVPPITYGLGISRDGTTVVGGSLTYQSGSGRGFRYNAVSATFEGLGIFSGVRTAVALASSQGGSVVVGYGTNRDGLDFAYRWQEGVGFASLRTPASRSRAVSDDGALVLVALPSRVGGAFLWTADGTLTALQMPQDGNEWFTDGNGMNRDGSVIVGAAGLTSGGLSQFAVWRRGELQLLGRFAGRSCTATCTNADGSVIGGWYSDGTGISTGLIWTATNGIETMADYLARFGLVVESGWEFLECRGISADGLTIAGTVLNRGLGITRGYVATIPGPGGTSIILGGTLLWSCQRGRRKGSR